MAKGRLIETITDRASGVAVEIRLSRDTDQFTAEVEGQKLQAPSLPEIRAKIEDAFRALVKLDWLPAIRVWLSDEDGFGQRHYAGAQGSLFLAAERLWVARRPDTNLIGARWESADEKGADMRRTRSYPLDRFTLPKDKPLALPLRNGTFRRGLLLPYDEALFAALQAMASRTEKLADALYWLLLGTAGRAFITEGSPIDPAWFEAAQRVRAADGVEGDGD